MRYLGEEVAAHIMGNELCRMGRVSSPFGRQAPADDLYFSRSDNGLGYDQALTMDRQPWDTASERSLKASAVPPGVPVSRDSVYLDLERNQGNDAEQMQPLLRGEILANRFGSYVNLIQWAPSPEVVHSGGLTGPQRSDVLPEYAKEGPGLGMAGYTGVIDGQALLDQAIAATRRALYGR